jgi:hypothetical protein
MSSGDRETFQYAIVPLNGTIDDLSSGASGLWTLQVRDRAVERHDR